MAGKNKKYNIKVLKRVLELTKPYKGIFVLTLTLALLLAPLSAIQPYLIKKMIDEYVFLSDMDGIKQMSLILLLLLFIQAVVLYTFIYSANYLGQTIIKEFRVKVFGHIQQMKLSFFDKTPIGKLTTRSISDIESINRIFGDGVITIVADIMALITVIILMFVSSWRLALSIILILPLLYLVTITFKEKVKSAFERERTKVSDMNSFLQEHISGMEIIQVFGAEKRELSKFKKISRAYTQTTIDTIFYYAIFFPAIELISALAIGVIVWYGTGGVLKGVVSTGSIIAFPMFISMLFRPMRMLATKFNTLQMGLVAANRVFDLLDDKQFIANTGKISEFKGSDVEFKNVSFSYDDENYVLNNINFKVKEGETLALVGSTGSGKTSIVNILTRMYAFQKGEILIGGVPIQDYTLESLRGEIGMVLQDVFLFSGSIFENIALWNNDITKDMVIESAKLIGADEFIRKLPNGYDYQVLERGVSLSMGQRQMISFIRALVYNPEILILDEATANIDPQTEAVIQNAIEKLIKNRSSIVVAHRLSTIKNADQILVLSDGKIIERGTHEALVKIENGHYQALYKKQSF